jgi:hypothetical protein
MHDGFTEANELALNATPHNGPTGREHPRTRYPQEHPGPTGNAVRPAASQDVLMQPLGVDHLEGSQLSHATAGEGFGEATGTLVGSSLVSSVCVHAVSAVRISAAPQATEREHYLVNYLFRVLKIGRSAVQTTAR